MKLLNRRLLVVAAALLAATGLAACGGGSGTSDTLEKITIGQYTLGNPYGLAIENGWFEEEFGDTEIEFVELEGTANALAGLASGDLDIALIGTPGAATALGQGLDIQVPWIFEVIDSAEALVVRDEHQISSPEDLKGLTIASQFGSTAHYAILQYLKVNDLSEKDVTLVDLGVGDLNAAFERGDIDGGWVNEPHLTNLVGQGGVKITTTGDLIEDDVIVADIAAANGDFAEKHPDALKSYIKVLDRSTQAFLEDPETSYKTMAEYMGLSTDEVESIMSGYQFLTAEEQADEKWLGGGLAKSIYENGVLWKEQDRVPAAASAEDTSAAVVTDFLETWSE